MMEPPDPNPPKVRKLSSLDNESYELYGDLVDIGHNNEILRLQSQVNDVEKRNAELESEVGELKKQLELVLAEKRKLEENCCLIYNTAMREIGRKDREIERLRSTGESSSSSGGSTSHGSYSSSSGGGSHRGGGGRA